MKRCPNCGTYLVDEAKFCNECGTRMISDSDPEQEVQGTEDDIPMFAPPEDPIPTFAPPEDSIPIFVPPNASGARNGSYCISHADALAVAACANCGNPICQDCVEAFEVTTADGNTEHLCYNCCQKMITEDLNTLTNNINTVKKQFAIQLIGMAIGFVFGFGGGISNGTFLDGLISGLVFACVGGVFLTALKETGRNLAAAIEDGFSGGLGLFGIVVAVLSFIVRAFILYGKCIIQTAIKTVRYILYLKRTAGFIEQENETLRQINEFMEYTMVRSQNKGIDLDALMKEGSKLANNAYAQTVKSQGEQAADMVLRRSTTRIAANGEIIRDFPATA